MKFIDSIKNRKCVHCEKWIVTEKEEHSWECPVCERMNYVKVKA